MKIPIKLLSLLAALALVTAACTGGGEEEGAEETEESTEQLNSETAEAEDTTTTTVAPEITITIDELEAQWATARAAVVERLSAEEFGLGEDNILRGPGGFELDLSACPAGWSDTAGIEENIVIGLTAPQSGQLAVFGNIGDGMAAYFDYINDNGGVNGQQLELIIKDDAYDADVTIDVVDDLLAEDDPFAVTTFGSPNTFAVYDTLNAQCVPQPFVQSGHPAFGDPVEHPFTTGLQMAYSTEAIIWGEWIRQELAGQLPVKVGALYVESDFGRAYEIGFRQWATANPDVVSEFVAIPHGQAAVSVTNEMANVAAASPDVFISMTAGNACLQAVQEAGNLGLAESTQLRFAPSVCKSPEQYMIPAGAAGDGFLIVGGGVKVNSDPVYAADPFVAFVNDELDARGLDSGNSLHGSGFGAFGWAHVEALRIAAELPGGLSRSNLLLAMRGLDLQHPYHLDGIRFASSGIDDAFLIEGSELSRYDAEAELWEQLGDPVDLDGASPNCPWVIGQGC